MLLDASNDRTWAADSAIALSSSWAQEGRRVVLADLDLENPILHERLGEPNLEGVSDIFLYGASLSRSARPAGTRGFYLVTAGTYSPDSEDVLRHPRWRKLVAGFADANASLILFAPARSRGLDALLERAARVVVLGNPDTAELPTGTAITTILTPPATAPGVDTPPIFPEPADDLDFSFAELPMEEELPGGRGRLALIILLIAAVVLAAAGYFAATSRPDLIPWISAAAPDSAVELRLLEAAAAVRAPTPNGIPLPYSVQVKAFTTYPAAIDEAREVSGRSPDVPVFISPERIGGVLYFKVLAGASPDSLTTTRLRQSLVEAGSILQQDAVGSWSLIQHTPLAFALGEFSSPDEAAVRIDSLARLDIPSYDISVEYSDGSRRWRVYGGAFMEPTDAVAMREVLSAAGLPTTLVSRTGSPGPV
ncbi:MAG TPA: hypothetical protein VFI91_05400 [Longimicrobiaceae bacterium]|nr:hypothetical protein [Longimicrobiaceae bacterium]